VGAVAGCLATVGTLRGIAASASFAILVYYGVTNLAALRMPRHARRFPRWVPATGLAACAVLALSLSPATVAVGVGTLAAGFAARAVVRGLARRGGGG